MRTTGRLAVPGACAECDWLREHWRRVEAQERGEAQS